MSPSYSFAEVTLINVFEVEVEVEVEVEAADATLFLSRWRDNAGIMAAAPGFIAATMYQALQDDTRFRFVNVTRWTSRRAWEEAVAAPEFRASTRALLADPNLQVTAHPALYQEVASYPA
jgi:heme-degrading monooxygenase HmoA